MSANPPPPDASSAAAWLAAIVESSDDAIIGKDLHGVIHSWNRGAERIFGYTAGEIIGTPVMRLIPPDRQEEEARILASIREGRTTGHFETRRLTKDGTLLDVSITTSPIRDGRGAIVGVSKIARDITEIKRREREIARLNRLYTALSGVNQAIVLTTTRDALLQKVCQVLVEEGGFQLAWVGWNDPATARLRPVAVWGDENDYIRNLTVYSDNRAEGRGPTGEAFAENRPCIFNDLLSDPSTRPWRAEFERRGFRASAVFPIRCLGEVCGTLSVYAAEPGFFQSGELALLAEAAGDISYGLDNFSREGDRRQAEVSLRQEHDFSEAMLNSLPGVLYLYDRDGKFLRWNRNFEKVSGYTAAEITKMHPLDFFAGEDRERVAARIGEVFAERESSVEADFVAKDGRVTPYFFTGIMTRFQDRTCLVGVGIDISARKQAETALRASEERFHAFMDATPTIAWITDVEGRHLFMNRAWDQAFGLDHADWIGKTAFDLVPAGIAERIRRSDQAVLDLDRAVEIPEDEGILRGKPFVWNCVKFPFRDASGGRFIGGIAIDITARKLEEAARRAIEGRYRTLFEQAPDGIVIADANSVYLDANASMCRMLGYTREELIGLHATDIVVLDEHPRIAAALGTIKARSDYHREWRFRRKDGSIFPAEVIATQMPDGNLLGMIRDITARREAETALREAELRFHTLFDQAPVGVAVVDPATAVILECNEHAARQLGYAREDFAGRRVHDFEAASTGTAAIQRIAKLYQEGGHQFETRHRTRTGELRDVFVSGRGIELGGRTVVHCVFFDITERKQAEALLWESNASLERKVADRTEELQAALVRAEAADRIKSAFLATMSHELRTPLNSIIGFTGIVLQELAGPLNPEQAKQLGMVRGSARHLLELINDVLDISKIEAGQLEVRAEPFDLAESIARVTALVRTLADKKNLTLKAELPADLGQMMGDRRRVEQILINLLSNAIKFTEQGGVTLTVTRVGEDDPSVTAGSGPGVRFDVSDTGIGLKPEDVEKLFQPFRQIDSGLTRMHEGTGLGLAICRRLAELMGGRISVASEWTHGSVFTVTLPLQPPIQS